MNRLEKLTQDIAEASVRLFVRAAEKYPLVGQAFSSPRPTTDVKLARPIPAHTCTYGEVDTFLLGRRTSVYCSICGKENMHDPSREWFI